MRLFLKKRDYTLELKGFQGMLRGVLGAQRQRFWDQQKTEQRIVLFGDMIERYQTVNTQN